MQINNFIAVVAPKEYDAIQAAAQLKVTWDTKPGLPGSGNFWSWMRTAGDTNTTNPARYTTDSATVKGTLAGAAKTVSATYKYQYNSFMPIGPHCAVADVHANGATVYVQAQALTGLPANLAVYRHRDPATPPTQNVRVVWYEGASSFGGGQTGEVNEEAVALSAYLKKPVRVQWMRWDQHGWDHAGVANMFDVTMGADANGNIIAADWHPTARSRTTSTSTSACLARRRGRRCRAGRTRSDRLGDLRQELDQHQQACAREDAAPLRRRLQVQLPACPDAPQQYFASEQVVDELAKAVNIDRSSSAARTSTARRSPAHAGWQCSTATQAAGWKAKVANSNPQTGNVRTGRGFGFGTFAGSQVGMVADVSVNIKSGKILVKHLYMSQNNGVTIGPQLVANQMSGAAIQGLSRVIWEQTPSTRSA